MTRCRSARQYIYFDMLRNVKSVGLPAIVLLFGLALFYLGRAIAADADKSKSKQNKAVSSAPSQRDYDLLQSELHLAKSGRLYMVFDFRKRELQLKMKAAVVWNYHLDSASVTDEQMQAFAERFIGDQKQYIRPISGKHLFAADKKTPDSVLAIVGKAVNIDPELLQREVPERFQLRWGGGTLLEVHTDVEGKPKAPLKNVLIQVGQVLAKPFGESSLEITAPAEQALTLYRATSVGLPTMVYPAR